MDLGCKFSNLVDPNLLFLFVFSTEKNISENQTLAQIPMASSSPPLPISGSGGAATIAGAATTSAFRAFASRLSDSVRLALAHRRPWYELLDRSAFCRPESLSEASARCRKNFSYFRINYLLLLSLVVALSLLTHPFSLAVLALLLAAWLFLYLLRSSDAPPLVLAGRQFSNREILLGLVALTVVVIFLTSVGSLLISAAMVGFAIIAAHGAFRVPEDLFLDDQEPVGSGLMSFLGGAASSAAASAAPAIATRV